MTATQVRTGGRAAAGPRHRLAWVPVAAVLLGAATPTWAAARSTTTTESKSNPHQHNKENDKAYERTKP